MNSCSPCHSFMDLFLVWVCSGLLCDVIAVVSWYMQLFYSKKTISLYFLSLAFIIFPYFSFHSDSWVVGGRRMCRIHRSSNMELSPVSNKIYDSLLILIIIQKSYLHWFEKCTICQHIEKFEVNLILFFISTVKGVCSSIKCES